MRKFTVLLAVAVLAASSTGCCCGKIRNWFHKGSPCGTSVAPAVLGAPLAMGTPMTFPTSAPMAPAMCVQAQPQCCVPCNPCCDPCDPCASGQMTTGYLGGYTSGGDCNCSGGGMMMSGEQIMVSPQPLSDVQ